MNQGKNEKQETNLAFNVLAQLTRGRTQLWMCWSCDVNRGRILEARHPLVTSSSDGKAPRAHEPIARVLIVRGEIRVYSSADESSSADFLIGAFLFRYTTSFCFQLSLSFLLTALKHKIGCCDMDFSCWQSRSSTLGNHLIFSQRLIFSSSFSTLARLFLFYFHPPNSALTIHKNANAL
jgi:hypothetical protein